MNLGQLIKHEKSFLDKSYTKYSKETSPRHFSKNSKYSISLDQPSEI